MKKIFNVLLAFGLVFCLLCAPALAAGRTYELDELGMRITVPSDHLVLTRDMEDNDPALTALGLSRANVLARMLDGYVYLIDVDEALSYEINVTMTEGAVEDFNLYSDTTFSALITAFETEYADMGITIRSSEIYQKGQAKFAKLYLAYSSDGEATSLQYYTTYNSKAISIILHSYSGSITAEQEEDIQAIVDSAVFDAAPQYSEFEPEEPAGNRSLSLYQLLQQGPAAYLPVLLASFAVTLVIYGAFPLLFARMRRKTITRLKYNLLCFAVNFLVMFLFIVINDSASSGVPYSIWTSIFSAAGTRTLKKRGVLEGYQSAAPAAGAVRGEDMYRIRFCRNCGVELTEGSRFCRRCGTAVTPE